MKKLPIVLLVVLIVLHQDYWNWRTYEPLVLGFIPVSLAWHVGISLIAGVLSWLFVTYRWPADVDRLDQESTDMSSNPTRH